MKTYLIAFCGMDGTGKTTLAAELNKYFTRNKLSIYYRHAHGYSISNNSFGIQEETLYRYKWLFTILSPLILLDSFYTYFIKYKPILRHRHLLCDRYFYDKIARLVYFGILPMYVASIFLKILPKPDYIFCLDIDEQTARKRKKEYSENEYRKYRNVYNQIFASLRINPINTTKPIVHIKRQIINQINIQ